MNQVIKDAVSNDINYNHKYVYALNDYDKNHKLEQMVKKHFDEAMLFASKFNYKKVKESIQSVHHVFRLQIQNDKNLISYDILHDVRKGDTKTVAYTILFNDEKFEYNNIKDAYKQFKTLVETDKSVETPQSSDGNIVTKRNSSDKIQVFNSQYNSLKGIAETNGYSIKRYTQNELVLYFKNAESKDSIIFEISPKTDVYNVKYSQKNSEQIDKNFTKLFQANKYVTELLTQSKVKGDKTVKEPLVKDVNDEIKNVDKFDKLFNTIVAYKETNDKGYTRLINFLTGELYKNKDIKSIIDLDYNGDTSQIKNIINNHFTKKK
jgi:ribosomal protein L17